MRPSLWVSALPVLSGWRPARAGVRRLRVGVPLSHSHCLRRMGVRPRVRQRRAVRRRAGARSVGAAMRVPTGVLKQDQCGSKGSEAVPDSFISSVLVDFSPCCADHDVCYTLCGVTAPSQSECDVELRACMMERCTATLSPLLRTSTGADFGGVLLCCCRRASCKLPPTVEPWPSPAERRTRTPRLSIVSVCRRRRERVSEQTVKHAVPHHTQLLLGTPRHLSDAQTSAGQHCTRGSILVAGGNLVGAAALHSPGCEHVEVITLASNQRAAHSRRVSRTFVADTNLKRRATG
mmetsp:Transcript_28560/g.58043  ORF Transcript_28560/g.58043 Transcript_28560/m.58043 type:complete len:292 (+) Transcript_28560:1164-2039(+)